MTERVATFGSYPFFVVSQEASAFKFSLGKRGTAALAVRGLSHPKSGEVIWAAVASTGGRGERSCARHGFGFELQEMRAVPEPHLQV